MARIGKGRRRRRGRGWLAVVIGLVLLALAASVAARRLKLAGPWPSDAPVVRIMPLGDSLTDGENIPGGYRIDLWPLLASDGQPVDFVGSQANGPASLPDRDHEGHRGWRIDEIAGSVDGWLRRSQPQVVLLLVGTNDVVQGADLDGAPGRLGALIDQILTDAPNARVIVGSIPPLRDPVWQQRAQRYNAAIPSIVSVRGERVSFVDLSSMLDDSDVIADGIHLAASGDRKVAAAWHVAIRRLLDAQAVSAVGPRAGRRL